MIIYTDGACSGNPGPMGIGFVIYIEDKEIFKFSKSIGKGTNNIAEYAAVLEGVKKAIEIGAKGIVVRSDSQLVVQQLSGHYRIKEPHLRDLKSQIDLVTKDVNISYEYIPREENSVANDLAQASLK